MGAILERKGGAEQENAADNISQQSNKMQYTKYKASQTNEMLSNTSLNSLLSTVYDRGVLYTDRYGRCELSAEYDRGELSIVYDRGELSTVYDGGVLSGERENANDHISLDTSSLGACHHNNYVGLLCNTL